MRDLTFERGLPAAESEEALVLGAILLDYSAMAIVGSALDASDFSLEKHKRIFAAMITLNEAGDAVDRVTVARWLMDKGQLESAGGMGYLNSLDFGLPQIYNLESYVETIKDKSLKRRLILSSHALIERALLDNEPAAAVVKAAEGTLLNLGVSDAGTGLMGAEEIIQSYPGGMSVFLDPARRPKGLQTGFFTVDEMTTGMHPGELVILAARPAMGKTALAMNIAVNVARREEGSVAVFSLEMSNEQLLTRMICAEANVDQRKFRLGFVNAEERRRLQGAASSLASMPLTIAESGHQTLMGIMSQLRKLKQRRGGLSLVVVDYLQLMGTGTRGAKENRTQEVSSLSRGLKLLAQELKVPFLVISQLNRSTETRPGGGQVPQLSDLRESGSIEQDADMVWFIFRPEYYHPTREELRGVAEVIIAKQRNGPCGKARLAWLGNFTKFVNKADDLREPESSRQGELYA